MTGLRLRNGVGGLSLDENSLSDRSLSIALIWSSLSSELSCCSKAGMTAEGRDKKSGWGSKVGTKIDPNCFKCKWSQIIGK